MTIVLMMAFSFCPSGLTSAYPYLTVSTQLCRQFDSSHFRCLSQNGNGQDGDRWMIKHPPSDRAIFGLGTNSLSLPFGFLRLLTILQLAAGGTPLTRSSEWSPRVPGSERAGPARPARFPDRRIPFNVMSRTIDVARGAAGPGELPGLALSPARSFMHLERNSTGDKPGKPCTNSAATKA